MPTANAPADLIRKEPVFPLQVDNVVLAGAAKTVTKPAGKVWALISVSALCYIRTGGAAVVPGADVTDGSGSFPISPQYGIMFNMTGVATFSIIGTAVVGIAWYGDHSVI